MGHHATSRLKQKGTLPQHVTPLVGREEELADLRRLLDDPDCRLLTLVGPGGIGKTRLAVEVATRQRDRFQDGVHFIDLLPVESAEFLIPVIADALQFPIRGRTDPQEQLLNFLETRQSLLVLDNFEHLLEGIQLVTRMLRAAPGVKFIATSREVLNLQDEWLYRVEGLPFPVSGKEQVEDIKAYDAVRFFLGRARRVRRGFSLEDEQEGVVRICSLVEGSPLALELAATWTKTLRCETIADEIQANIDFLASTLRDVPERHRSLHAVFDQSWKMLSADEQSVFMRLAVFREGFTRDAAERIASASLPLLSSLVDKSLLVWTPEGGYKVHQMLRFYGGERLSEVTEQVWRLHQEHCKYYADLLYGLRDELMCGKQAASISKIESELKNMRAAWNWAVENRRLTELKRMALSLDSYAQFQSGYLEWGEALEKAIHRLQGQEECEDRDLLLAELLVCQGWIHIRLGRHDQAGLVFEDSRSIYAKYEAPPALGMGTDPVFGLGILALIRGYYNQATALGEQGLRASKGANSPQNISFSYYVMASAALAQGRYKQASEYARQASSVASECGDRWFTAYCLIEWGNADRAMGNYPEAKGHFQASYAIREEFNDPEGMAVALNHLGQIAYLEKAYKEAQRLYQRGLDIYLNINDKGGLAVSLAGLGKAALALGDNSEAKRQFSEGIKIAAEIQFMPVIFSLLTGIAELLVRRDKIEDALELLAFVRYAPASPQEEVENAQGTMEQFQGKLSISAYQAATERGAGMDLDSTIKKALVDLDALAEQEILMTSQATRGKGEAGGELVEPLTERELEVLELIATGLTNQDIADELVISTGTVKWYTSQIYAKLSVSSRTGAVARARELGLIS
jgi:predicted ATPase/DNA-binding CsgD family transcriptional regulator